MYTSYKINSRFKSGQARCRSVQNLLSSSSLSKNINIMIYRTIILPVVLHGRQNSSLAFREEHRLRVFENISAEEGRGNRGVERTT